MPFSPESARQNHTRAVCNTTRPDERKNNRTKRGSTKKSHRAIHIRRQQEVNVCRNRESTTDRHRDGSGKGNNSDTNSNTTSHTRKSKTRKCHAGKLPKEKHRFQQSSHAIGSRRHIDTKHDFERRDRRHFKKERSRGGNLDIHKGHGSSKSSGRHRNRCGDKQRNNNQLKDGHQDRHRMRDSRGRSNYRRRGVDRFGRVRRRF